MMVEISRLQVEELVSAPRQRQDLAAKQDQVLSPE